MASTTTKPARRSDAAREAWGLLFEFFMSLDPHWDELAAKLDLSSTQAYALYLLQPGAGLPMHELADQCHCDPSNLTGVVDRLEARGLVERRPDEHDRRVKLIFLTRAGTRLRAQALALAYEPPPQIAALSTADQRTLRDILKRALGR